MNIFCSILLKPAPMAFMATTRIGVIFAPATKWGCLKLLLNQLKMSFNVFFAHRSFNLKSSLLPVRWKYKVVCHICRFWLIFSQFSPFIGITIPRREDIRNMWVMPCRGIWKLQPGDSYKSRQFHKITWRNFKLKTSSIL